MSATRYKLGAAGRKADQVARAVLSERGEITPDMETAIARYAKTVDLAARAWDEIPADSLLSTGSTGQTVTHPSVAVALQIEREAARHAQALGLEGRPARSKGGRPVGAVSAPDRAAAPPKLKVLRDAG